MTGDLNALFTATLAFVGGHFLLSSRALRVPLARSLGPNGFLPAYSIAVGAAFLWMLSAYRDAPYVEVWPLVPALAWVPAAVMPFALFLAVAGLTTRNPTMVGGEQRLAEGAPEAPAPGIISVTRHPFLWGTALWAASHLVVNGDLASVILMGGILALSLGGMAHIDQRREETLGSAWGPVKLTTGVVPFAAIASRRASLDWRGIGWWRPVLAVALYLALAHGHEWLIGVSALPMAG